MNLLLPFRSGLIYTLAVLTTALAGCATSGLSLEDCGKQDWTGLGKSDLLARRSDAEFQKIRDQCVKQEYPDPMKEYVNGRFAGLKEVCTTGYFYFWGVEYGKTLAAYETAVKYDDDCQMHVKKSFMKDFDRGNQDFLKEVCAEKNAYEWGKTGGRRIVNCKPALQPQFDQGYESGLRIFELNEARKSADEARASLEAERVKADVARQSIVDETHRASLVNPASGKACSSDRDCIVTADRCFFFSCRTTGKSCVDSRGCEQTGNCLSNRCTY